MKTMIRAILLLPFILFVFLTTSLAVDTTVFGLKMGEKFSVVECDRRENSVLYKFDTTKLCYRRFPIFVSGREQLPITPLVSDTVLVKFPMADMPDIAALGEIRAVIIEGNLEGVFSYTRGVSTSDYVLTKLKEKYGKPSVFDESKTQNGLGATFGTFVAVWTFDLITVEFNSITDSLDQGQVSVDTKKNRDAKIKRLSELEKAIRKI